MATGPDAPKFGGQGEAIKRDGAGNVVPDDDATAAAYVEFERREAQEIVKGLRGEEVGSLIYDIPHGANPEKNPDAVIDCGHAVCKYKTDGKYHVHVVGVSVGGIDEISRIYESIQVWTDEPKRIHREGRYYWRCRAVALDAITGTMKPAFAEQPEGSFDSNRSGDDMRSTFPPRIAERKAKRNAVQEILPQPLLNKIKQWGREGKDVFDSQEVERLIQSLGISRRSRPPRYLLNPITGQIAVAMTADAQVLTTGTRPALSALPPDANTVLDQAEQAMQDESTPMPQEPAPTPEVRTGPTAPGSKKASEKQRRMLFAISKQAGVPDEVFRAYLTQEFAIESTRDLAMKDVDTVKEFLEAFVPKEKKIAPDEDLPF